MSETESKLAGGRSPAYPFIPLEKALARAEELRKAVGRNDTRIESAKSHWKYGPKSSGGIQTLAALRHFGLIDETQDKRIKLSDLSLRILMDQRPDSQERRQLIQVAALNPKMHGELWGRWHSELPVDAEIRHYLVLDRKFNENGADDLIAEYKATLAYAKMLGSDNMSYSEDDKSEFESGVDGGQMHMNNDISSSSGVSDAGRGRSPPKSDFTVLLEGNRLKINATVDKEGIGRLKQVLDKYEEILRLLQ